MHLCQNRPAIYHNKNESNKETFVNAIKIIGTKKNIKTTKIPATLRNYTTIYLATLIQILQ